MIDSGLNSVTPVLSGYSRTLCPTERVTAEPFAHTRIVRGSKLFALCCATLPALRALARHVRMKHRAKYNAMQDVKELAGFDFSISVDLISAYGLRKGSRWC